MQMPTLTRRALLSNALAAAFLATVGCSPFGGDDDETPTPAEPADSSPTDSDPPPTETPAPPGDTPTEQPPPPADTPTEPPPPPPPEPTETPTSEPPPPEPTSTPTHPPHVEATPTPPGESPPDGSDVWSIWQFETEHPVIVLTFDAGADRGYAADILDVLAAEGIRACFGMTGVWAEANPDLIERIVVEGHHLINHSWSHPDFTELTSEERADQLRRVEDLIWSQVGVDMRPYFRPPFGAYNESVLTDLARNSYTINVMWTIDTLGWRGLTADEINQRVMDGAAPGAIVLMHVGAQSLDAIALPEMIRLLREQGYWFATTHDLIAG